MDYGEVVIHIDSANNLNNFRSFSGLTRYGKIIRWSFGSCVESLSSISLFVVEISLVKLGGSRNKAGSVKMRRIRFERRQLCQQAQIRTVMVAREFRREKKI